MTKQSFNKIYILFITSTGIIFDTLSKGIFMVDFIKLRNGVRLLW